MHCSSNTARLEFWLIAILAVCIPRTATLAQGDSGFKYIEVKVVDSDGKPLPDVEVDVKIDSMAFPMPTDDEGIISLNVPGGSNSRLRINVKHADYVAETVSWRGGDSIPGEYTVKLAKGVPIGGIVHDENGQPIEGVEIHTQISQMAPGSTSNRVTSDSVQLAQSDEQGRWTAQVKETPKKKLALKLAHEDYLSHTSFAARASWDELKQLDHVLTLEDGLQVIGTVTDPDGDPIDGAILYIGQHRYENDREKKTTRTDAEGRYRFTNAQLSSRTASPLMGADSIVVTVAAEHWAPELRLVKVESDMESVDFQLQPGKSLKFLVTDVDDVPIAGARVVANQWRQYQTLPQSLYDSSTNDEGIWQSDSLPADPVYFSISKQGYMQAEAQNIGADGQQHKLVMQWPLLVSGKVVDAESGLPLETFNVVQGIDWGNNNQQIHWERYNIKQGRDGKYRTEFNYPRAGHYVRIEAEGYRPNVSRMIRNEEGEVTVNFQMEEGTGPSGVVTTVDGKPAASAELLVATPAEPIHVYNGHAQQHQGRPTAETDEQGKYQLPFFDSGDIKLVCRHESGYAILTGKELEASANITLSAWATLQGRAMVGDQPLRDETIQLYFQRAYVHDGPNVHWSYNVQTDAEGNFKFDQVISGEAVVARVVKIGGSDRQGMMSTQSHSERAILEPGKNAQVQIGGVGRTVRGQVKVPENYKKSPNWERGWVQMVEQSPPVSAPGIFESIGRAIAGGAQAVRPQPTFRRNYSAALDENGQFEIYDILPGRYQATVQLYPPPQETQNYWQPIGTAQRALTVSEQQDEKGQDIQDLGELTLKMVETPSPNGVFRLNLQQ